LLFATAIFLSANVKAKSLQQAQQLQIEQLLNFVKTSECLFIRNGDEHSGKDAAKHMQRKFDHYKKKIDSAERFIELSATKSSMSGKLYQIRCPNEKEVSSKTWLLKELARIRK